VTFLIKLKQIQNLERDGEIYKMLVGRWE